jgi:flagellar hook-length control protein FliK
MRILRPRQPHPPKPRRHPMSPRPAGLASRDAPSARAGTEGRAADGKTDPGKTKDAPHANAKAVQPHPAVDEASATGRPAEPNAKASATHQAQGQASEHASTTARIALTATHGDAPAPASVAQSITSQLAGAPPVFALSAVNPLPSPLQTFWQPTTQHPASNDNTVPISGLAVEIVSRAQDGLRRFEIRLDPPELGRIDVRLDVDRGGNVTSRLTVERSETLDLLRRDAPQLERALQHAGLNTEGGLQFSLRDQNFANREQTRQNAATFIVAADEPAAADAALRGYGRLVGLGGGVDIRV